MSTKTHNADWTVEVELPTQRWELQQLGAWDNTYGQLVKMDYASDATEGWCDAEDVAKLEARVKELEGRAAKVNEANEKLRAACDELEAHGKRLGADVEADKGYMGGMYRAARALLVEVERQRLPEGKS